MCNFMVQGRGGGLGEAGIAAVYPPGRRPPGQGLDPSYLAVQLRKLQKKQKGMLHELQATAAREAFWQSSSQSAEKALDEVHTQVWQVLRHTLCMLFFKMQSFLAALASRLC